MLADAYQDFTLSRQAKQCSPQTLRFYHHTAGVFLRWLEGQGITSPDEVTARHVRGYLAHMNGNDTTHHDHARAIKTLLRFWLAEGYIQKPILFDMPKVSQKRLPCLSAEQVGQVLAVCNVRDRALILLMVDSGLRRGEVIALDWGDVDMASGLVKVRRGKGGKARASVVGPTARRGLLAYRRTLENRSDNAPMFQAKGGTRFTPGGLVLVFYRISKQMGFSVTAHSLRRSFAILSLRAGMDVLHLQALGGWADLSMVAHYAQMVDTDLLEAHAAHSPIDNLGRLK